MKTAIVTGGGKGLGLAQTTKLLQEGYRVYVVSRTRGDLPEHPSLEFRRHDLTDWHDTSWLEEIHAEHGSVHALVNNAGMHLKKPVWDVSAGDLEQVLNLNVKSMFTACGRFVELQKEQGGAIVNISSMAGLLALPSAAAYVTAKTAVIGVTRAVAIDAAQFGIRCNTVCPGFIETRMTRKVLEGDPARRAKIEGRIPSGKWGRPEDVANAVAFLVGDAAAYINGVTLPVDAGYSVGF